MVDYSEKGEVWYAMMTTYQRELKAKAFLDVNSIDNFVPMVKSTALLNGRRVAALKPAIHNLIFVRTDVVKLKEIKSKLNYIHNRLTELEGRLLPIIVPTEQMDRFIQAMQCAMDEITIVDLADAKLEKGISVRIAEGKFKGYVGVLSKIKGKRNRRVTINVEGVVAYTVDVDASFIEKI